MGNWAIGDILNYAEDHFGEEASQLESLVDHTFNESTLRNIKWVCRAFPLRIEHTVDGDIIASDRKPIDKVPWSVHRDIVKFQPDERLELLKMAEHGGLDGRMTYSEFRSYLSDYKKQRALAAKVAADAERKPADDAPPEVPEDEWVQVGLPPDIWELARKLADKQNREVSAYLRDLVMADKYRQSGQLKNDHPSAAKLALLEATTTPLEAADREERVRNHTPSVQVIKRFLELFPVSDNQQVIRLNRERREALEALQEAFE